MSRSSLHIPFAQFEEVFPFYFMVDRSMRIVSCGKSLKKLGGGVEGKAFEKAFQVVRPRTLGTFDGLAQRANMLFVLDLPVGVRMRGQFLYVEEQDRLLFLGSPWVSSGAQLADVGLSFKDFALHDPTVDFLPVAQTQRNMLADAHTLAEQLEEQRNEARRASEYLTVQYEITRILSAAADRLSARDQVVDSLTREMHWDAGSSWLQMEPESAWMTCVATSVQGDADGAMADWPELTQKTTCRLGEQLPGFAWWANDVVWLEDLHGEVERYGGPVNRYEPFASAVVLPVWRGTVVIGAVELLSKTPRPADPSLTRLLREVGVRIGQFIERRESESALRSSEQKYRMVVESVREVIFKTSADGIWTLLNPAWTEITGFSVERTLGTFFLDYVHPEDRDRNVEQFQLLLRREKDYCRHEIRYVTADDGVRWMEVYARLVFDDDGQLAGTSGTLMDITDRKRSEQQMMAARDEAHAANRAKSEFLSRMSHELRTPLNAVLGFGQLLEMADLPEAQAQQVGYILGAGNHLLSLIDEVLDISRIESGRLSISTEEIALTPLIEDALRMVRPMAEERGVVCISAPELANLGHARADLQRTKQILINLLSNAVKYNSENGYVRVSGLVGADQRVRISVSDTGHGIPREYLESIFTPFERAGAERTDIQGTGLGLAVSKALVEAMGGAMGVESVLGEGSTFWFELPMAVPREGTPGVGEPDDDAPADVLYIEDNIANLTLVRSAVERRPGVRLLPAMQGAAGLKIALEQRPALILLDLHLPDMHGEEILAALRDDPRTAATPVVVTTADTTPGLAERMEALGANGFLPKPVDVREVLTTVDRWISGSAGETQEPTITGGALDVESAA